MIGFPPLRDALVEEFSNARFHVENDPYHAPSHFMMNRHMVNTDGIALDVPKHMVAQVSHPNDLILDRFELDGNKIEGLGRVIAKASVVTRFAKKGAP